MDKEIMDLIEKWENIARRYKERLKTAEGYVYENLHASASTFELCAEQLKHTLEEILEELKRND